VSWPSFKLPHSSSFKGLADPEWLYDLLSRAEDDYIGEEIERTSITLAFVVRVAQDNESADPEFGIIAARALTLNAQIEKGLAYTGRPRSFVIRRNPRHMIEPVSELVQIGGLIAKRSANIAAILADATRRRDELANSADLAKVRADQDQNLLIQLSKTWNTSNDQLKQLDQDVRDRASALERAEGVFQQAILDALAPKCGFKELLTCIGAIAAVYAAGIGIAGAAEDAIKLAEADGLAFDNMRAAAKIIVSVEKDAVSISNGYDKIKELLDGDGRGALLVVDASGLDHHLDVTLKAIEAVKGASPEEKLALQNAVIDFVGATKARNQAILRMDEVAVKAMALNAELNGLRAEEARLRSASQSAIPPDLVNVNRSLKIVLRRFVREVRDFIWEAERAVDYYTLRPYNVTPGLNSDDIGTVGGAAGDLILAIENYISGLPGEDERFPVVGDHGFALQVELTDVQRASLRKGKLLVSFYPADLPHSYARARAVFADVLTVTIDGVPVFFGSLEHLGESRFTTVDDVVVAFLLQPSTFRLTHNPIQLGSLPANWDGEIENADYLGLSPFSDWLIQLDDPDSLNGLAKAKSLTFTFSGKLRRLPPL
jgi:hypothetical protein